MRPQWEAPMTLKGKHALVTGSSRGIGRGIALKLAERGARVAVHYYQNEDAAKNTLAKIREFGSDGFLVQADVCHSDEVSRIFQASGQGVRLPRHLCEQRPNGSPDLLPDLPRRSNSDESEVWDVDRQQAKSGSTSRGGL